MKGKLITAALGTVMIVWGGAVVALDTCYGESTTDCCLRTTNPPQTTLECNGEPCPDTNIVTFNIDWSVSVPWSTVTGARTGNVSVVYQEKCSYRKWYCNGQGTCIEAGPVEFSCTGRTPGGGIACGPLPPEG